MVTVPVVLLSAENNTTVSVTIANRGEIQYQSINQSMYLLITNFYFDHGRYMPIKNYKIN